jgi:hypothetical protein
MNQVPTTFGKGFQGKGQGGKRARTPRGRQPCIARRGCQHAILQRPRSWAAHLGGEDWGGRLLQQLLVAALDGAVALAQVHHVAVLVGQHLRAAQRREQLA